MVNPDERELEIFLEGAKDEEWARALASPECHAVMRSFGENAANIIKKANTISGILANQEEEADLEVESQHNVQDARRKQEEHDAAWLAEYGTTFPRTIRDWKRLAAERLRRERTKRAATSTSRPLVYR